MTTLDKMWVRLEAHQPYADKHGYGPAWAEMCRDRTVEAADAAWDAAWDAWAAAKGAAGASARAAAGAAGAIRYIEMAERFYNEMDAK